MTPEIGIRITAQGAAQARAEITGVTGGLDSLQEAFGRLRSILGGVALGYLAKEFIGMADAVSLTNARLKLVTTGAEEFNEAQQAIYRIAQSNNVGLQETAQLYTKLADPIKRLGGTTREVSGITESFATALRLGGASAQEAGAATLQFAQAMASGKLQGDEFRSLAEASPRFMRALADGMKVPVETLKQLGTEGKLTADIVGNALLGELSKLQQEARGLPDTVGGAMTRLKNDVLVAVGSFNELTGSTVFLADVIGGIADLVRSFSGVLRSDVVASGRDAARSFDLAGAAIGALGTGLEVVAVLGANVGYVFKGIGREIGGLAAQAVAFASGNFSQVGEIRRQMVSDSEAARAAIDRFSASVVGTTQRVLQQRDAVRSSTVSTSENSAELARFARQQEAVRSAYIRLNGAAQASADAKKAERTESDKLRESYTKLAEASARRIANNVAETEAGRRLTKSEEEWIQVFAAVRDGKVKLADLERDGTIAKLRANVAAEQQLELTRAQTQADEKAAAALSAYYGRLDQQTAAIAEQAEKQRQQNVVTSLGAEAVQLLEIKQIRATAARLRDTAAANEAAGGLANLTDKLRAQAAAYDELAQAQEDGIGVQQAKVAASAWEKVSEQIGQGLTDSLFRAFESGKGFFDAFFDSIKNTLKTTVLRVAMAPVNVAVGSLLGGTSGMAQASQGMNMLSSLGSVGRWIGTGASALGSGLSAGWGATMGAGFTGTGLALEGAGAMLAEGQIMAGLGQGLGALGPYAAAAMAIYTIAKALDKSGTPHMGSVVSADMSGIRTLWGDDSTLTRNFNRDTDNALRSITGSGAATLNALAGAFGGMQDFRAVSKFAADGVDASIGQFIISRGGRVISTVGEATRADGGGNWQLYGSDAKQAFEQYVGDVGGAVRRALDVVDLPEWARKQLDSLGSEVSLDQLSAAAGEIINTQRALTGLAANLAPLGGVLGRVAGLSGEALMQLAGFAGGIEELSRKVSGYVSAFYTSGEQAAISAAAIARSLGAVGIDSSQLSSRGDFRALVESLDVTTETGRRQLAALLSQADAFAQLSQALEGQTLGQLAALAPQTTLLSTLVDQNEAAAVSQADLLVGLGNTYVSQTDRVVGALGSLEESLQAGLAASAAATADLRRLWEPVVQGDVIAIVTDGG